MQVNLQRAVEVFVRPAFLSKMQKNEGPGNLGVSPTTVAPKAILSGISVWRRFRNGGCLPLSPTSFVHNVDKRNLVWSLRQQERMLALCLLAVRKQVHGTGGMYAGFGPCAHRNCNTGHQGQAGLR